MRQCSCTMLPSYPPKTNPTPNFFSTHSVILPVNLQTAYKVLGTGEGHNRVCGLSKLCVGSEINEKDEVTLPVPDYPEGKSLGEVSVRTAPTKTVSDFKGRTFTRQQFFLEEAIPIFFGLFTKRVQIVGTLTWDESVVSSFSASDDSPVEALYESRADAGGVFVWKLRTFDKVDGEPNKTRVTERIEGRASPRLLHFVQSAVTTAHRWVARYFHYQ